MGTTSKKSSFNGQFKGGYYYLADSDVIMATDELYFTGRWLPRTTPPFNEMIGRPFSSIANYVTRRSIYQMTEPGEGYRLLEEGEQLIEGDEWFDIVYNVWEEEAIVNRQVGSGPLTRFTYRRKIEEPKVERPVYIYLNPNETVLEGDEWYDNKVWHQTLRAGGLAATGLYRRRVN